MPISIINRVKTITLPLSTSDGANIVTIYQNNDLVSGNELLPTYKIISFNSFIKNLKVYASIKSLPEANLPDFQLADSATQKVQKVLDIEWKSARKQLNVYIASDKSAAWQQVGSLSLLNPSGYAFRIYNLMDMFTDNLALELGENSKIGISVENVGYGILAPNDKVTVHGSYVEEIILQSPDLAPITNVYVSGTTNNPVADYSLGNSTLINNEYLVSN